MTGFYINRAFTDISPILDEIYNADIHHAGPVSFQPTSYPLPTDILSTANRHPIHCQPTPYPVNRRPIHPQPTSYPLPTDILSKPQAPSPKPQTPNPKPHTPHPKPPNTKFRQVAGDSGERDTQFAHAVFVKVFPAPFSALCAPLSIRCSPFSTLCCEEAFFAAKC